MTRYVILLLFLAVEPFTVSAYLDPGTGSFIIQVVIAAIVGASFTLKMYWGKAAGRFSNMFKSRKKDV